MSSILSYSGELGDFKYDDAEFKIEDEEGYGEYLRYIGSETDGTKINIPNGIENIRSMFECSDITSMPVIPDGVVNMDNAFLGASRLKLTGGERIPDGVTSMNGTFSYCVDTVACPDMPDSVISADNMLDGNIKLEKMGHVSDNLQSAAYMCNNCMCFKGPFDILPEQVKNDETVFANCFGKDEAYESEEFMQKAIDDRAAAFASKIDFSKISEVAEKLEPVLIAMAEDRIYRDIMPFDFSESVESDSPDR